MKKMLIAVAVVLAAGLMTSCNKGEGCYKLTYKTEIMGTKVEHTMYVYGDGEDIEKAKNDIKALDKNAKITQIKVNKSAEDCAAANN